MPMTIPVGNGFYHGPNGKKFYSEGLRRWQQEPAPGILAESYVTAGGLPDNDGAERVVSLESRHLIARFSGILEAHEKKFRSHSLVVLTSNDIRLLINALAG